MTMKKARRGERECKVCGSQGADEQLGGERKGCMSERLRWREREQKGERGGGRKNEWRERERDAEKRRDNMLLAARGTAGQLLLCSVLVWGAAPRTVTLLRTHTHTNCSI